MTPPKIAVDAPASVTTLSRLLGRICGRARRDEEPAFF